MGRLVRRRSLGSVVYLRACAHPAHLRLTLASMGTIDVRVSTRSARPGIEVGAGLASIRVRAAPEGGKATDEALRTLAKALGVPPSSVALHSGRRSRTKVFAVEGLSTDQIFARLQAL